MEKFNTLAEVRCRKDLVYKDISACEDQILKSAVRPFKFLSGNSIDKVQKVKKIVSFASTAISVYSLVKGFRKK